jgi:hypothetical protein
VELGNADLANRLREAFDIARRFNLDLATTVVPVIALDIDGAAAGGRQPGGARYGQFRGQGGVLTVQVIGVRCVGPDPIFVREVIAHNDNVGYGQIRIMNAGMIPGGEDYNIASMDSQRTVNARGVSGQRTNAEMIVGWDVLSNEHYVPMGKTNEQGYQSRILGPWVIDPGQALYVWGTSNNSLGVVIVLE